MHDLLNIAQTVVWEKQVFLIRKLNFMDKNYGFHATMRWKFIRILSLKMNQLDYLHFVNDVANLNSD